MAACALEFEFGEIGVYQVLASKHATATASQLLTRRYMYAANAVNGLAQERSAPEPKQKCDDLGHRVSVVGAVSPIRHL